jgi:hypothetical protein
MLGQSIVIVDLLGAGNYFVVTGAAQQKKSKKCIS